MSSVEYGRANLACALDENVITLSMLGTISEAQLSQGSARRKLSEVERKWCCLLDELSLLCDYRTGGKSVTSVAAQSRAKEIVFWFASNQETRSLIKRQLQWILLELQKVSLYRSIDSKAVLWRLFKKSVLFNRRRVESYWSRLDSLVQNAYQISTERQKDPQIAEYLNKLIGLRDNHEELCLLAFKFRNSSLSVRLRQHMQQSQHCGLWQAIRHYIGRLGSWWNACSTLVSTAQLYPTIFSKARIVAVQSGKDPVPSRSLERIEPAQINYSPSPQHESDIQLPLAHALLERHWGDGAMADFTCRLQRRQAETRIHAELLVLNHFYRYNLKFAENVRYIGCSKLSCYCCHAYMKNHPLDVIQRPCHGNTWTRWEMPSLKSPSNAKDSNQDAKMLADMVDATQHGIETCSLATTKVKQLESTTGFDQDWSDVEY